VLDHHGMILVLTPVAVRRPERAIHPSTSSVGQVQQIALTNEVKGRPPYINSSVWRRLVDL
jgi:hypothetical protein